MVTPIGSSINMLKRILSKIAAAACILWLCSACSGAAVEVSTNTDTFIYPDYAGVTIPINIAPLNFHYTAPGIKKAATTVTFNDDVVEFAGKEVVWDMQQWKSLVASAVSDTIRLSSELVLKGGVKQTYDWEIYVSADKLDPYVSYRLIEPGYEVWHEVEIRERCIENFEDRALSDWQNTDNSCMNCHIHSHARADLSMFYVRGKNGGAFLNSNGEVR